MVLKPEYTIEELMTNTPSDGPQRCAISIAVMKANRDKIDLSPEAYQRFFHANIEWQQQFLTSFFVKEIIIPEIAMRVGTGIPKANLGITAEVMDGCQRVSTLFSFIDGNVLLPMDDCLEEIVIDGEEYTFDLRGKSYAQLPPVVRQMFDTYQLSAMMYYNLTPQRAGQIFVNILNNSNTLNAQEKRQAISSAMSRQVQQWSRFNPLPIFETLKGDDTKLKLFKQAIHLRLDVDKIIAEICFMLSSDSFKTRGTTGSVIDDYYVQQALMHQDSFKNEKHIKSVFKFVEHGIKSVPNASLKMSLKVFRNYCYRRLTKTP